MKKLCAPKMSPSDVHNKNSFKRSRVNSIWRGTELVSYLGPRIWDLVPNELKESDLPMFSNSKLKDGSLNDAHTEYVKYSLSKWGL